VGDLVNRFRYPLTYLVLALASLLSIASPERGERTSLASQVLIEVKTPLDEMVTLPGRAVISWWRNYVALFDVRRERDEAERENAKLRQKNIELQEQGRSSERLARLQDFQERNESNLLRANVSAQDLSPWYSSITIDKGSADKVSPGMAVITDEGVVGVVSGVALSYARVLLVVDPQIQVHSFAQRSRARGAVRGRANGLCNLEYVPRDADVQVGDTLLTSGLGGIYPRGLLVGTVTTVAHEPPEMFKRVEVKPAVEFSSLEEVFVILERRTLPEPTEFSTESEGLWAVPDPAPAPATPAPKQQGAAPLAPPAPQPEPAAEEGD
jgi:rod shape-determining protein MreC